MQVEAVLIEKAVDAALPVVVRLIENALTSSTDQGKAYELLGDRLKLRASAQARLDARKAGG